jgi:hypothetical protein|tara:strand:+ start:223 stop:477 length:255 start_codon:yes stop_codon:yes gene_type:complete
MVYTRNYQQEYANESPERRKMRVNRNLARRQMMRLGKVKVGDGKDVHHVGGNALNKDSKLKVVDASKNRSFRRNKNAGKLNAKS